MRASPILSHCFRLHLCRAERDDHGFREKYPSDNKVPDRSGILSKCAAWTAVDQGSVPEVGRSFRLIDKLRITLALDTFIPVLILRICRKILLMIWPRVIILGERVRVAPFRNCVLDARSSGVTGHRCGPEGRV